MPPRKRTELSNTLLRIRGVHRLFQHEMGGMCGVSARTYLRWENGYHAPTDEQFATLVRAMHGLDEIDARTLAASRGASLESLGIVAPAADAAALGAGSASHRAVARGEVEVAMYVAAEEMEIPARRVRAPLAKLLRRLAALGVTFEEASVVVAPPPVAPAAK